MSYKEESYKLDVNVDGNLNTTTMFTYDKDNNFSGFWFYKDNDNDENNYVVNDKGKIISNSKSFNLESGTFVRRIGLNEGEIGETQSVKNDERIIYIAEKATIDGVSSILYNKNTLKIVKSENNSEWVGKYYIEFTDSTDITIQLIVDLDSSSIIYPEQSDPPRYSIEIEIGKGVNFDITDNTVDNKTVCAYRSRDVEYTEFDNNNMLFCVHLVSGIENINRRAFGNCYNLKKVIIPSTVIFIDEYAFTGCHDLKNIEIPDSVTEVGERAFFNCEKLTEIIIRGALTIVGLKAFNTLSKQTITKIYCDDKNTKVLISADAIENGYDVKIGSLDDYYTKI